MNLKLVRATCHAHGERLPLHGPLVILAGKYEDLAKAYAHLDEIVTLSFGEEVIDYGDDTANAIADAMASLEELPGSRERSMVKTKLDEAMMWLHRAIPPTNEAEGD